MSADIPENWPEIAVFVVTVVGWFVTLERRLMGKQDKDEHDEEMEARRQLLEEWREQDRTRTDEFFRQCFERIDRNQSESLKFKEEIRDGLNDIRIKIAKLEIRHS